VLSLDNKDEASLPSDNVMVAGDYLIKRNSIGGQHCDGDGATSTSTMTPRRPGTTTAAARGGANDAIGWR
jgi:hypothetical protein